MSKGHSKPKRDIYGKKIGPPQHLRDHDILHNLRKGHNDKNDNYCLDDEEDGLQETMNDDAIREMMNEEIHYNRGRIGRSRDAANGRVDDEKEELLLMGDYDPKMPYDEEAEQIEITKNLDNHILHDLIETPVKRQLPNRVERPREAFRKLVESNLSVALQSPQFKDFCKYLETDVAKDPKKCTCLICWQFVSDTQKKLHEAHGHHCLNPGKIRCEKSFLHYAKLFHHLTWDGIILLIKPAVNDTMAREKLQTMNLITHELKSRRENRGNYKGHPPFLSTPLCNINMKPIGISSAQILEKTHEEKITQQGFVKKPTLPAIEPQSRMPQMSFGSVSTQHLNPEEPPILNYGPLTDGYTAESRDKLCRIMAHLQEEMGSILRTHDEISHKLTLIATKQFQQEHPVGMYQVPDSQNMLEKVTLSQLESSSGIQLVQPPDDGKFYDPEKLMKHVQEGGYTSGQSYELFHCWKTARYNK